MESFACSCNRVLKPPGGGSSDIFGTSEENSKVPAHNSKKYASSFTLGGAEDGEASGASSNGRGLVKGSSIDSADGASVSSQTSSTTNGTPDNSEPNTPRSGESTSEAFEAALLKSTQCVSDKKTPLICLQSIRKSHRYQSHDIRFRLLLRFLFSFFIFCLHLGLKSLYPSTFSLSLSLCLRQFNNL